MEGGLVERRVQADGFAVRLLEAGSGEPLVYLHSGGGLHLGPAQLKLAEGYHLVGIEIPGFGDSPVNDRTENLDQLADTLAATVEAAGIETPFSLVGTSLGGACGLFFALNHPDLFKSLALVAPAAFRPDGWRLPRGPEEVAAMLYAYPERREPRGQVDREVVTKQQALLVRLLDTIDPDQLRARMPELHVPTLVTYGADDKFFPAWLGRTYRELIPNCSYILIYDAGHEVWNDRPEATIGLIRDFLRRQELFVIGDTVAPVAP